MSRNQEMKNIRYPPWVQSAHLILGDVCYADRETNKGAKKMKHYFDGKRWVSADRANAGLKKISKRRSDMLKHNQGVRATGIA